MSALKTIPKEHGLPIIGNAIPFYKDMLKSQVDMYNNTNHSPVIETQFLDEKPILLYGPDAHQWVLFDREGLFSSHGGWERQMDAMFPGAIISMDGTHHRFQRRIMQSAFKSNVLKGYVEILNRSASQSIDAWNTNGELFLFPNIKRLLLEAAAPTFLGISLDSDNKGQVENILNSFIECVEATIAIVRYPIPPFKMWKGVRSRKKLEAFFYDLLEEKRKNKTQDFFSQFCHAESEEGERYSDEEVVNHGIFLLMAAHDTTSSALTTLIYNLGKNTQWQDKLRQEVLQVDGELSYEKLSDLQLLSMAMKESMRLYPSVPVLPRKTTREAEFNGYRIPKDRLVALCVMQMHHDPDLWIDPETFDPQRFSDERAEHKTHKYKYVPFGGGAHMCIGQHFAEMQVKIIMNQLLRRFRWTLADDYEMEYQQVPLPKPKDGLPIKFEAI